MRPAEAVELIYRDELAHSSIWLAGVKLYLAFETYCFYYLFLIHISEPTRQETSYYAVFCMKKTTNLM